MFVALKSSYILQTNANIAANLIRISDLWFFSIENSYLIIQGGKVKVANSHIL